MKKANIEGRGNEGRGELTEYRKTQCECTQQTWHDTIRWKRGEGLELEAESRNEVVERISEIGDSSLEEAGETVAWR